MEKLIRFLTLRLRSVIDYDVKDELGNVTHKHTGVFKYEDMKSALRLSLCSLNMFLNKDLSFKDGYSADQDGYFENKEIMKYADLIVHGAVVTLLAGQAIVEKSKEYAYSDGTIDFAMAGISDVIMRQWELEYSSYMLKVQLLKQYKLL